MGWSHATISPGAATLAYPSRWKAIPGDKGTVTFSLRDRAGRSLRYLNLPPRHGSEQHAGWAAFRAARHSPGLQPRDPRPRAILTTHPLTSNRLLQLLLLPPGTTASYLEISSMSCQFY